MNVAAKKLPAVVLVSFLFSHCGLFSIVARSLEKPAQPTGGLCVNSRCCCDHSGPSGERSKCEMCSKYTPPAGYTQTEGQCCLFAANCNPTNMPPPLTTNKDLQSPKMAIGVPCFVTISIAHPFEYQIVSPNTQSSIFHPPKA